MGILEEFDALGEFRVDDIFYDLRIFHPC
jgi:hypothetical protein